MPATIRRSTGARRQLPDRPEHQRAGGGRTPRSAGRSQPWRRVVARSELAAGIVALAFAAAACGTSAGAAHHASGSNGRGATTSSTSTSTTVPASAPTTSAATGGSTTSTTSTTSTGSTAGASSWPALVAEAMASVRGRTNVPLEAPRQLPGQGGYGPNSATVQVDAGSYEVGLYHCPSALPVGDKGIGTGSCGALDNYFGGFGGRAYTSDAAATAALASDASGNPAPTGCPTATTVELQTGIAAAVHSGGAGPCEVTWEEGKWHFELTGDLSGWRAIAAPMVSYLDHHLLPETRGDFSADLAPDGQHTGLAWTDGRYVHTASSYHGALAALSLAVNTAVYPG